MEIVNQQHSKSNYNYRVSNQQNKFSHAQADIRNLVAKMKILNSHFQSLVSLLLCWLAGWLACWSALA